MKISKKIEVTFIIVLVLLFHGWLLDARNFFIFDDFSHFLYVQHSFPEFSLVPSQMYNDRPVGSIFLYFFFQFLGTNHQLHHLMLLFLHITSSVLLYGFLLKLFSIQKREDLLWLAFPITLLFALWTRSTFAIWWSSAIFDLVGLLFSLTYLLSYTRLHNRFSWKSFACMLLSFFLMVRSKEATLLIAAIPVLNEMLLVDKSWKITQIRQLITNRTFLICFTFLLISFYYIVSLFVLGNKTAYMGFGPESPYYTSLNPLLLGRNMLRYLYSYFSILETGFNFQSFQPVGVISTAIGIFMPLLALFFHHKNRKLLLFFMLSTIAAFLPVLPMVNTQHKLYLYIPSVFLAALVLLTVKSLLDLVPRSVNQRKILLFLLILVLLFTHSFTPYLSDKKWWILVGEEGKRSWESMGLLPPPEKNESVILSGTQGRIHIFIYGPGNAYKLFYNEQELTFALKDIHEISVEDRTRSRILYYKDGVIQSEEQSTSH